MPTPTETTTAQHATPQYPPTPWETRELLANVGILVYLNEAERWTPEQRTEACTWASAVYFDDADPRPRPEWLPAEVAPPIIEQHLKDDTDAHGGYDAAEQKFNRLADGRHPEQLRNAAAVLTFADVDPEDLEIIRADMGIDEGRAIGDVEQEKRDALADFFLSRALDAADEVQALEAAAREAVAMIVNNYKRIIAPHAARRDRYTRKVVALAEFATFSGKRKSRVLPHGTYGYTDKGDRFEITDAEAATEWAKVNEPGLVRATLQLPLDDVRHMGLDGDDVKKLDVLQKPLAEHHLVHKVDIPGTRVVPAHREYYAEPKAPRPPQE